MEKKTQNRRSQSINNSNKKDANKSINNNVHASSKKRVNPKFKKTVNKISIGTIFILGLVSFYLIFRILVLNMIPMKYFIVILLVIFAILGVMSLLLINRKIKWKIKIGGIVFSLIMIIGMLFASHYIENTIRLINKVTGNNSETSVYYLVALKNSKIDKLSDIKSEIGYIPTLGNINEAVDELNKDNDFKYKDYKQIDDLKNALLEKEIEVALIGNYFLEDEEDKFDEKVKIIYTINIVKEKNSKSKKVDVTKDAFNIYISGIDTYGEIGTVARSDVNIIASVNPKTKQILLTTIPRDFYVTLHEIGEKDKLTHAGLLGIDTSVGTIEDLLDIDINYYVRVNFSTLEDIVDALDGVDVYSDVEFRTYYDGISFVKGYNHVDGKKALIFARERKAFIDGDRQRGKNQQAVIKAIINKAISPSIISNYSDLLKSLEGTFQTNMSASEIQKFAKFQIDKMPSWDILSISLNGSDASKTTYLYGNSALYVMIPNESSVNYAKEKIKALISGEKIEVKEEKTSDVVQYSPSTSKPNNDNKIEENDTENNNTDNQKPEKPVNTEDNQKPSEDEGEDGQEPPKLDNADDKPNPEPTPEPSVDDNNPSNNNSGDSEEKPDDNESV